MKEQPFHSLPIKKNKNKKQEKKNWTTIRLICYKEKYEENMLVAK